MLTFLIALALGDFRSDESVEPLRLPASGHFVKRVPYDNDDAAENIELTDRHGNRVKLLLQEAFAIDYIKSFHPNDYDVLVIYADRVLRTWRISKRETVELHRAWYTETGLVALSEDQAVIHFHPLVRKEGEPADSYFTWDIEKRDWRRVIGFDPWN